MKSPFGPGAGGGGGEAGGDGASGFSLGVDGGDELDPTLGGPCEDDGQCDDGVGCTTDRCDNELGRCRFSADDAKCDDGVYCDGVERCDLRMGCVEGDVVACSDNSTCTIDTCVEETQGCRHDPRDADGDGDPTRNCGGNDCDDTNPLVSSESAEICGNGRDDDCDGEQDEADCGAPQYDTCADALSVTKPGFYEVDLTAAGLDYPSRCATMEDRYRDVVLEVTLPEGGPYDLDLVAKVDGGRLALGVADECGEPSTECVGSYMLSGRGGADDASCARVPQRDSAACGLQDAWSCDDAASAKLFLAAQDGSCRTTLQIPDVALGFCCPPPDASVSRLILRGVGPGTYPVYVAGDAEGPAQVQVQWRDAEDALGDGCGDAVPIVADGDPVLLRLPSYTVDTRTECSLHRPRTGDAFVSFTLAEPRDVTLVAEAQNGLGAPLLSLLSDTCGAEKTCRRTQPARLFDRALPAGSYKVLVAGTTPDDVSVRLETAPVSEAPPGEGCDQAEPLVAGTEQIVDLSEHEDAVHPQCLVGAPDATFDFELSGKRDVMLIGRFSNGDTGSVSFVSSSCDSSSACGAGSWQRVVSYGMAAGTHRAVIESARGNPVGISWLERPVSAPVVVPFSDDCDAAVSIPEAGGRFTGNTSNAFPDFDAGCDVGGQAPGGAPDQLLKLHVTAPRRVILDMQGSAYDTMLSVRKGPSCPGAELQLACAAGYGASRSFLDLELQAGDYFIQIDGYDGDKGPWKLDVFTAEL